MPTPETILRTLTFTTAFTAGLIAVLAFDQRSR